jgi:hypothetical protein
MKKINLGAIGALKSGSQVRTVRTAPVVKAVGSAEDFHKKMTEARKIECYPRGWVPKLIHMNPPRPVDEETF